MIKIKQWFYRLSDMGMMIGFMPFNWKLGVERDKGLRRIIVHLGPFAFTMTYWLMEMTDAIVGINGWPRYRGIRRTVKNKTIVLIQRMSDDKIISSHSSFEEANKKAEMLNKLDRK